MAGDAPSSSSSLPLAGVRVLDFTHAAAGPFATMLLADLGAEIIKIERPGRGDGSRDMGKPLPGFPRRHSDYYASLNRNKKDVALDLSHADGVRIALKLTESSDIVIQNFRPGVMDRLGLGFNALRSARKNLIYCSISAFGAQGPWSEKPANDIIMQSISGLMGVTGELNGGPVRIGAPISDFSTGLFALSSVTAALYARDRHPNGQHIEISMLESSLNMMCNYIPSVSIGEAIPRLGRGHAQIVPYQAFLCQDQQYVMVGAFTRNFWHNLCRVLDRGKWIDDPQYSTNSSRLKNRNKLVSELEALFALKPRDEWLTILEAGDVPCSPVLDLHEAVKTEQVRSMDSILHLTDGERSIDVVRSPFRSDAWGKAPRVPSREIGQDTGWILRELARMSDDEIETAVASGAVAFADDRR